MRILSIGNSFSQDATWYLHEIAEAGGREAETWNLYIGGCSLYRHAKNLRGALKEYSLEINGQGTAEAISRLVECKVTVFAECFNPENAVFQSHALEHSLRLFIQRIQIILLIQGRIELN